MFGTKNSGTRKIMLTWFWPCFRSGCRRHISNTEMKIRKLRRGKSGQEFPFDLTVVDIATAKPPVRLAGKRTQDSAHTSSKSWTKRCGIPHRDGVMTLDQGRVASHGLRRPIVKSSRAVVAAHRFHARLPSEQKTKSKRAAKRSAFNRALKDAQEPDADLLTRYRWQDLSVVNEEVNRLLEKEGASGCERRN